MINEKNNMRTEVLFSDDKTHRFILKKSWDTSKPMASIIMIAPSARAGDVCSDMTTMYVVNNCFHQGFGSVEILNLYSKLDTTPFETCSENDEWILKSCQKADKVILAWGKCQTQKSVDDRISAVVKLLEPLKEKLYEIVDDSGKCGLHPLCSAVRLKWALAPYNYPS